MYYKCIVKTKFKEIGKGEDKQIVLDLPCQTYMQIIYSNGKDRTYSHKVKDSEVIALISVKESDIELIKAFKGYVGDKWEDIKKDTNYLKHYPYKVKDIKRKVSGEMGKASKVVEYTGSDKDEPAMLCSVLKPKDKTVKEMV